MISKSWFPPAIASIGGKTYIVPDWTEVPYGTTLDQIQWDRENPTPVVKVETRTVTGSKGNTYTVTRGPNGKWHCDCTGYQYRKTCKHVQQV